MPNALTGDFEAVLQLNRRVVNGVLATMHQDAGSGNGNTMPHTVVTRIDDGVDGGVRGSAWAQVGAPAVELIAGEQQQFVLTCWIRARFHADATSAPFPEFIHGELRTICRIDRLASDAGPYLHVAIVSASFTSDGNTTADQQIAAVLTAQLTIKMPPTDFFVPADVTMPDLISLVGDESAVAIPLSLGAGAPAGAITSLQTIVLDGHGVALAVSQEFVLGLIAPITAAIAAAHPTFSVDLGVTTADYVATITPQTPVWLPTGGVHLPFEGTATTENALGKNVSFHGFQDVPLVFDEASESFALGTLPAPDFHIDDLGIFEPFVKDKAEAQGREVIKQQRDAALKQVSLPDLASQKQPLIALLQKLDPAADVTFTSAAFSADGIVLRGQVSLSARVDPVVSFAELTDGSGYTAFESWIPGGRITGFRWTWFTIVYHEATGSEPGGQVAEPHEQPHTDRFIVTTGAAKRTSGGAQPKVPIGTTPGPIGGFEPGKPAPGLGEPAKHPIDPQQPDEKLAIPSNVAVFQGQVCLKIDGVRTTGSGEQETIAVEALLKPDGFCVYQATDPKGLQPEAAERIPHPHPCPWYPLILRSRPPEDFDANDWIGGEVLDTGGARVDRVDRSNVVVVMVDPQTIGPALAAVGKAITDAKREDAGVLLALVLPERTSRTLAAAVTRQLAAREPTLPAMMVMVTEDRQQTWSQTFAMTGPVAGASAMCLMNASGEVVFRADRLPDAAQIAAVLRTHLQSSRDPRPRLLTLRVRAGDRAPDFLFDAGAGREVAFRRLRGRPVIVTFIAPESFPSMAVLGRLRRLHEQRKDAGLTRIAIVDGADAERMTRLRGESSGGLMFAADPQRRIARRYGVQVWPTTVAIGADGRIAKIDMGADAGALMALARARGGRPYPAY